MVKGCAKNIIETYIVGSEKSLFFIFLYHYRYPSLTSKTVQCSSLPLESIYDIHGCHGLPLCMLGVGNSISDHVLKEYFEHTSGFFVYQTWDTLDTSTTGKTPDSWFCDSLDIITKNFSVTLGTSFAKTFASLSTSSHDDTASDNDTPNCNAGYT